MPTKEKDMENKRDAWKMHGNRKRLKERKKENFYLAFQECIFSSTFYNLLNHLSAEYYYTFSQHRHNHGKLSWWLNALEFNQFMHYFYSYLILILISWCCNNAILFFNSRCGNRLWKGVLRVVVKTDYRKAPISPNHTFIAVKESVI